MNSASTRVKAWLRPIYVASVRPYLKTPLARQRLTLAWYGWGYLKLFRLSRLSLAERLDLMRRFLRIDWHVPHAHWPGEIAAICQTLNDAGNHAGEVVVEAGCWQGGSSAKFSIICRRLGYRLWIYDSFQGVAPMTAEERRRSFDFSGSYQSPQHVLVEHLKQFGELAVCTIHPGWFAETLARPVAAPVRVAYIDCDVVRGTKEALAGVLPALVSDGHVFSQDCHIEVVTQALSDPETWSGLGRPMPRQHRCSTRLVRFTFPRTTRTDA